MYIREINKLNNEIAKDSRKGVNRLCYEKLRESTQKSIINLFLKDLNKNVEHCTELLD